MKNRNDSIVWRGPKKTGMIKEFLNDVAWNDIDYLIIDTPPGTSDEHITVMENLKYNLISMFFIFKRVIDLSSCFI